MTTLHEPSPEKLTHRKSVGEAAQLSRPPVSASGLPENLEYETATSSSGPSSLAPDSLSSASSFQSIASSVGSKSSSGICADSAPTSPEHLQGTVSPALDATVLVQSESSFDNSYVNVNIPDLDDLISACEKIDLGNSKLIEDEAEISLNQTFESATDDTTLVTLDESALQTFKTCSGPTEFQTAQLAQEAPKLTEDVFKVPLPLNSQKSVVPYVAADSTISKQNSDPDDLFKSALNSFSENSNRKHSLTPCVEIDVVEAARDKLSLKNANETFEVQEEEEGTKTPVVEPETTETEINKQSDTFVLDTPDATFEEVEAFNTTQTLDKKLSPIIEVDSQESIVVAAKTPEKPKLTALNQTEVIENNSDLKKEDNLVEDKSWKEQINKSIIEEAKSPRESILNKTNTLNQSKTPVKTDSVPQENILSHAKTETPIQINSREDELNRTNTLNQSKIPNKADNLIQENIVSTKSETPAKVDSNVKEELVISGKVDDAEDLIESPAQKEFISPIKREFQEVPSNKKLNNIYNFEVTSSTPLPNKDIKKETPKTPKNRSNLFPSETNSAPSSPQALEKIPSTPLEYNNKQNKTYFDETVPINKSSFDGAASELVTRDNLEATSNVLNDNSLNHLPEKEPEKEEEYEAFKPQQQSTSLPPTNFNFEKLQEAALDVAKDIDSSLEKFEEGEHFVSATTELFEDPAAFDFLTQAGSQQPTSRGDRYDSLFMKFDPLAEKRLSMLSQKNNIATPPAEVEEDEKETKQNDAIGLTPKKNPAIAAIDRLLFDSPSVEGFNSKVSEEAKAKQKDFSEKPQSPLVSFVDEKMVKELELVRSSVLQLEEELERQKQEHKQQLEKQKQEYKQQLDKIKENCEDKITNVQTKLLDEIKCKDQMTVVVEEYEKSISRLIADREKDKSSLELEKARLQEELDLANQHLSNTEAAFSDVHSKYERLKKSVAAYRSNEAVLKESIAENQETIKTLENRYEQLKSHAMAQLEKANMELDAIRKQHDAESVKLKALLRKAELKSKSLEETVEQKMKENKELTKIIDEMIARVN